MFIQICPCQIFHHLTSYKNFITYHSKRFMMKLYFFTKGDFSTFLRLNTFLR